MPRITTTPRSTPTPRVAPTPTPVAPRSTPPSGYTTPRSYSPATPDRPAPDINDLRNRLNQPRGSVPRSGATPDSIRERYGLDDRPHPSTPDARGTPDRPGSRVTIRPRKPKTDPDDPGVRRRPLPRQRTTPRTGDVPAPEPGGSDDPPHRVIDRIPVGLQPIPDGTPTPVPPSGGTPPIVRGPENMPTYEKSPGDDSWFDESHYQHWDHDSSYYLNYHDHHRYDHCLRVGYHHGFEYGIAFCSSHYDQLSHVYWYYRYPGYKPYYCSYNTYYRPSSYYLPAYYPTYSSVHYVTEYVDDTDHYPVLPTSEPIDPSLDVEELLALGWELFAAEDYAGAAEAFRQAILGDPGNSLAKFAFSQALFSIGNYPDAAFLIRRGMELLPDWPALGEDPRPRYANPSDHIEQILALRTFLDYLPDDPSGILVLAVQSFFAGDDATARLYFEKLLEMDATDAVALGFLERLK
jgi:tetratricopeptide (TPR) repeat protein